MELHFGGRDWCLPGMWLEHGRVTGGIIAGYLRYPSPSTAQVPTEVR